MSITHFTSQEEVIMLNLSSEFATYIDINQGIKVITKKFNKLKTYADVAWNNTYIPLLPSLQKVFEIRIHNPDQLLVSSRWSDLMSYDDNISVIEKIVRNSPLLNIEPSVELISKDSRKWNYPDLKDFPSDLEIGIDLGINPNKQSPFVARILWKNNSTRWIPIELLLQLKNKREITDEVSFDETYLDQYKEKKTPKKRKYTKNHRQKRDQRKFHHNYAKKVVKKPYQDKTHLKKPHKIRYRYYTDIKYASQKEILDEKWDKEPPCSKCFCYEYDYYCCYYSDDDWW